MTTAPPCIPDPRQAIKPVATHSVHPEINFLLNPAPPCCYAHSALLGPFDFPLGSLLLERRPVSYSTASALMAKLDLLSPPWLFYLPPLICPREHLVQIFGPSSSVLYRSQTLLNEVLRCINSQDRDSDTWSNRGILVLERKNSSLDQAKYHFLELFFTRSESDWEWSWQIPGKLSHFNPYMKNVSEAEWRRNHFLKNH